MTMSNTMIYYPSVKNHVKRLSVNPGNDKIAATIEVAFIYSTVSCVLN